MNQRDLLIRLILMAAQRRAQQQQAQQRGGGSSGGGGAAGAGTSTALLLNKIREMISGPEAAATGSGITGQVTANPIDFPGQAQAQADFNAHFANKSPQSASVATPQGMSANRMPAAQPAPSQAPAQSQSVATPEGMQARRIMPEGGESAQTQGAESGGVSLGQAGAGLAAGVLGNYLGREGASAAGLDENDSQAVGSMAGGAAGGAAAGALGTSGAAAGASAGLMMAAPIAAAMWAGSEYGSGAEEDRPRYPHELMQSENDLRDMELMIPGFLDLSPEKQLQIAKGVAERGRAFKFAGRGERSSQESKRQTGIMERGEAQRLVQRYGGIMNVPEDELARVTSSAPEALQEIRSFQELVNEVVGEDLRGQGGESRLSANSKDKTRYDLTQMNEQDRAAAYQDALEAARRRTDRINEVRNDRGRLQSVIDRNQAFLSTDMGLPFDPSATREDRQQMIADHVFNQNMGRSEDQTGLLGQGVERQELENKPLNIENLPNLSDKELEELQGVAKGRDMGTMQDLVYRSPTGSLSNDPNVSDRFREIAQGIQQNPEPFRPEIAPSVGQGAGRGPAPSLPSPSIADIAGQAAGRGPAPAVAPPATAEAIRQAIGRGSTPQPPQQMQQVPMTHGKGIADADLIRRLREMRA